MNFSYLYSVLDLYLINEKNGTLVIEVLNKENIVKIDFSYSTSVLNKTYVKIAKDSFFDNLDMLVKKIQADSQVVKNEIKKAENQDNYYVEFTNSRSILFLGFKDNELNRIIAYFTGSKVIEEPKQVADKEIVESYNDTFETHQKKSFAFSMGFASYLTIFLTAFWLLDIFMIALWVFKTLK